MRLSAKEVKGKLQNERNCIVYVYLRGANFAYDTELESGCIGKLVSLDLQDTQRCSIIVKQKRIVSKVKIANIELVQSFEDVTSVEALVLNTVIEHDGELWNHVNLSSTLKDDCGFDSLDLSELIMKLEKKLGIIISDYVEAKYFESPNVTIGGIAQYLYEEMCCELKKTE